MVATIGLMSCLLAQGLMSQSVTEPEGVQFAKKSLGGPRLGFTVVPGNTELAQKMKDEGISPVISQFGWHFEHRVVANGNGPAFVIEFIPLIGGVEYGKPLASLSLMFGIRMPSGYEFGVGPNAIVGKTSKSGLIIALGKTFDVQGVSIPLNLAYATSPIGARLAFIVGYAL
jgi:hypothetical protein